MAIMVYIIAMPGLEEIISNFNCMFYSWNKLQIDGYIKVHGKLQEEESDQYCETKVVWPS